MLAGRMHRNDSSTKRGETMDKHLLMVFSEPAEGKYDEYQEFFGSTHLAEMANSAGVTSAQMFTVVSPDDAADLPTKYVAVYQVEGDIAEAQKAIAAGASTRTPLSSAVNRRNLYWLTAITEEVT